VRYETRIRRIASYHDRDGRIISFYDSITLIIMAALVILLMLTENAVPQFHNRPGRWHADDPGLLPPLQQATDRGQDA
jgi:hypothetical protein